MEDEVKEEGRLNGKVAIITGAANGIGRATAVIFAKEGAKLVLADVNEEGLNETLRRVKGEGRDAVTRITDVAVEEDVRQLIELAIQTCSQIDILCNNAGIAGRLSKLEEQDAGDWRTVFGVNVMGAVFGIKHVAKHMQERRYGAIVNTASVAGIRSGAGGNAYSASKAAIIHLTQTAACDLGGCNEGKRRLPRAY